jgi:hypothetical protein
MKKLIIALLCSILVACSPMDLVKTAIGAKPGLSVDTELQVGKENTKQVVGQQTRQDQQIVAEDNAHVEANSSGAGGVVAKEVKQAVTTSSKKVTQSTVEAKDVGTVRSADKAQDIVTGDNAKVTVTQNAQLPFWAIFLLILGWALPTPVAMFQYCVALISTRFSKK